MIFDEKQYTWVSKIAGRSRKISYKPPRAASGAQLGVRNRPRSNQAKVNITAVLRAANEIMATLKDECQAADFNPQQRLVELLKSGALGQIDPALEARTLLGLLEYIEPKLKAVEHRADKPIEMVVRWAESAK